MDFVSFFKNAELILFPVLSGLFAFILLFVVIDVVEMIVTKFGIFHYRLVAGFQGKKRSDDFYWYVGCGAICVYGGSILYFLATLK